MPGRYIQVLNAGVVTAECMETRVCTALDPQEGRVKACALPAKLVELLSGCKL
jgi:hypothetical protein